MRRRPRWVLIVFLLAWAVGTAGLAYHAWTTTNRLEKAIETLIRCEDLCKQCGKDGSGVKL